MFIEKIYNNENKELKLVSIEASADTLNDCQIINTGAIVDGETTKGIILSVKDNNGNVKVVIISSESAISLSMTE